MNPTNNSYFLTPAPISDAEQDFYTILSNYPKTLALIDKAKISDQLAKKYPSQFQFPADEFFDFFMAVLYSNTEYGKQSATTALSPEGSLNLIEEMLNKYPFTQKNLDGLTDKLCNLFGTKFWDTISELLALKALYENTDLSKFSVEFEYDFGPAISGSRKNADIAFINKQDGIIILVDVCSPILRDLNQKSIPPTDEEEPIFLDLDTQGHEWLKDSLIKKYNTKFSEYCQQNPTTSVSVLISFIKIDHLKGGFPYAILKNAVERITAPNVTSKIGFKYGLAFSAASHDGKNLSFVPLGEIF